MLSVFFRYFLVRCDPIELSPCLTPDTAIFAANLQFNVLYSLTDTIACSCSFTDDTILFTEYRWFVIDCHITTSWEMLREDCDKLLFPTYKIYFLYEPVDVRGLSGSSAALTLTKHFNLSVLILLLLLCPSVLRYFSLNLARYTLQL